MPPLSWAPDPRWLWNLTDPTQEFALYHKSWGPLEKWITWAFCRYNEDGRAAESADSTSHIPQAASHSHIPTSLWYALLNSNITELNPDLFSVFPLRYVEKDTNILQLCHLCVISTIVRGPWLRGKRPTLFPHCLFICEEKTRPCFWQVCALMLAFC